MDTITTAGRRKRRPNFSSDFRKQLAQQACEPGVSISHLAQQHDINVNMLFKWRRQLQAGLFDAPECPQTMLPVTIIEVAAPVSPKAKTKRQVGTTVPPAASAEIARHGTIEIQIDGTTVRFDGQADMAALRAVVKMLRT